MSVDLGQKLKTVKGAPAENPLSCIIHIIHPLTHRDNAAEAEGAALCPIRRSLSRADERPTVTRSQETKEIAWNTVADTQKGHAN